MESSIAKTNEEFQAIKQKAEALISQITPDQKFDEKYLHELIRFSDSSIHSVSSFLGGVASQEIIKILIAQYTILNHTLIYDGIHGRCGVFSA